MDAFSIAATIDKGSILILLLGTFLAGLKLGHYLRDRVWTSGSKKIYSRYTKEFYKVERMR